ncbi:lasso peptide biosynthesis B2 protein [Sphingomonas sp. BIUV-7]|uniref:Lasso peptide biosynthesis B2 protein n=1 Tax=Sphingomonas natans TaxID=3063330 RepID=A0ABT8YCP0_9SPHN|nr:lasso peptide biosynthesis B2 protein [Sphingomonas sp. BIUV-7]MDO6416102.1 lasso peptide biosynthesis B2 protein [Sphingomonas sp. BIUV-7]
MGLKLRRGLSFCRIGKRILFLDVTDDRYFCLKPAAEFAFARLVTASEPLGEHDQDAIAGMIREGLLVPSGSSMAPRPCEAPPAATRSLLDIKLARPTSFDLSGAAWALARATLLTRAGALDRSLRAFTDLKSSASGQSRTNGALQKTAAAFEMLTLVTSPLDRCLPRSLAMARRLAMQGLRPDLLIGVQLHPFRAHAWVQHDDWLANDRLDAVRSFTPILAL